MDIQVQEALAWGGLAVSIVIPLLIANHIEKKKRRIQRQTPLLGVVHPPQRRTKK